MTRFVGEIQQVPPMYSAVKVKGKRLYEYARAGQMVERPIRKVTIKSFTRTSPVTFEKGCARFTFRVACSKGTYIRTLAVDLSDALGYAGHMSKLQRTAANGLHIADALTLEQIETLVKAEKLDEILQPNEVAVSDLPRLYILTKLKIGLTRQFLSWAILMVYIVVTKLCLLRQKNSQLF